MNKQSYAIVNIKTNKAIVGYYSKDRAIKYTRYSRTHKVMLMGDWIESTKQVAYA